jgi:hypothetical protein
MALWQITIVGVLFIIGLFLVLGAREERGRYLSSCVPQGHTGEMVIGWALLTISVSLCIFFIFKCGFGLC